MRVRYLFIDTERNATKAIQLQGGIHAVLIGVECGARLERRYVSPGAGHLDHAAGVHEAEAVARADLEAALVHDVVVRLDALGLRGEHDEEHDVAPRELRIGLERQRYDAGGEWRRCRRARVLLGALVMDVGGDDLVLAVALVAAAVGGGQRGRALLEIPRLLAVLRRAADRERVDAVGVAVAGARVVEAAAVARRPHEYGTEAVAAHERAVLERLLGQGARAVHYLAVVVRSPAGRVDGDVVRVVAERARLHRVRHVAVQHSDAFIFIFCDCCYYEIIASTRLLHALIHSPPMPELNATPTEHTELFATAATSPAHLVPCLCNTKLFISFARKEHKQSRLACWLTHLFSLVSS